MRERSGDVLVFLSGEREIRDTAEALSGRLPNDVDILPLYARLSTREQQRVFRPHDGRRIVLATNVAETSLTVPGIRYVVDPGTARISRYSARLKVQRLPIEPISQASADQRKGRCGRVADGICIRLYSEEDFEQRPRFTDPEILRTNLASVILQMKAAGLGDVEDFPFLDPPDRRQVRDGIRLLDELAALDGDERLTPLGRRLAQLPVDPRLGRMVLEGDRRGCAGEVIVIAAALSIVDPRERPADKREEADALHARFADERSDFLALREPLGLPARAAAGAVGQPVPQALPRGVPAPPARARVAGPRGAAAPGGEGRRGEVQHVAGRAGRDPRRAALGPALADRHARRRRGASTRARAARASRSGRARRWRASSRAGRWSPSWSRRRGCGAGPPRGSSRAGPSRSPATSSSAATTRRTGSASGRRSWRPRP